MTHDDRFGETLSGWLDEEARHRVPDHLGEVLVRTAATRQRPWWSSLERLLPVTSFARTRAPSQRPLLAVAIAALLVLALAGIAVIAGALWTSPVPAPFGLAPNGRIVVTDANVVRSFAADGSDPIELATLPDGAQTMSISPDGTRVALPVLPGPATSTLTILSLVGGPTVTIPVSAPARIGWQAVGWSPDGRWIVFADADDGPGALSVVASDGSGKPATPRAALAAIADKIVWQPSFSPDGEWIAFGASVPGTTENADLMVMHPDGSDLHIVISGIRVGDTGNPVWAPDPTVDRLLFTRWSGVAFIDLGETKAHAVGGGFWPSWSPDGTKVAFWKDQTVVVSVADVLAGNPRQVPVFAPVTKSCQDSADLTGKATCYPVTWSPDGTQLLGRDIGAAAMLVTPADGTGTPISIPLHTATGFDIHPAWQPLR